MALIAAFVGLSLGLGGCIFSPKKGKGPTPDPIVYPNPDYPEQALDRLVLSYAARDSAVCQRLYDTTYQGESQDLTDGTSVTLTRADEVAHIDGLARATTITSVVFTLGTASSIHRQSSGDPAHPEWAEIQISGAQFHLEVNDQNLGTLLVNNTANTYIFRFKPTSPWAPFKSDTIWALAYWREIKPS